MKSIMLDLETLSTRSNALILSIGAVQFDTATGRLGKAFYQLLDSQPWIDKFHIDLDTFRWWLSQTIEARSLLVDGRRVWLNDGLTQFSAFVAESGGEECQVWGNGASFDNSILKNAYESFGTAAPWKYSGDRCFRTFRGLYGAQMQWPDAPTAEQAAAWGAELPAGLPANIFAAHSALGDAIVQARALLTVYGHKLA